MLLFVPMTVTVYMPDEPAEPLQESVELPETPRFMPLWLREQVKPVAGDITVVRSTLPM